MFLTVLKLLILLLQTHLVMLKYIHIQNFKSLKSLRMKPSRLNLFFGINGMGKSSFIQSLLLLRQSKQKATLNNQGLLLNDKDLISIGTGKDAFYQSAGKDECIQIEIHSSENNRNKWSFGFDATSDILPLKPEDVLSIEAFSKIEDISLFNNRFQYLAAEHSGPQKLYPKSELEVRKNRNLGTKGEYCVHYLSVFGISEKILFNNLYHPKASSAALLHQTAAWLGEISPGTRLAIEDIKGVDLLKLGVQFESKNGFTNEFSPVNVGFGILYVLPVIVSLLKAEPGALLFIENPESHLHPKGQAAIGRLMALASQNGVQVFCESHSDHIINSARVAVRENCIDTENLAIYYFDRSIEDDEHKTRVSEIFVDGKGELSNYPSGLLDEWSNLLMKLI